MQLPEERTPSYLMAHIGGVMDTFEEGHVIMTLVLEERHMNPNGVLHGGIIATLMDEATGGAIATSRGLEVMAQAPHATIEMNVSFLSGARPGDELIVEARTLRSGRSVGFAEAEVRRKGKGDLIAKGRFTFAILAPRNV